jgi:hypothetical protein
MLMGNAFIDSVSFHTDILTREMCRLIVASQIQDLMTSLPRKRKQQVFLKNVIMCLQNYAAPLPRTPTQEGY